MKLLICEDDVSTIDVIESQLNIKEMGIDEVLRAYDGNMAIDLIDQHKPEVVLCDIGMPNKKGTEVLRYIHEKQMDIQFAFLTCYDEFEYAKMAIQFGACDYITKPFELDELRTSLLKMVARVNDSREETNHQVQQDSLINSVLRQLGYGIMGNSAIEVSDALKNNGVDIDANSTWQIVFTCADIANAIERSWDKNQLIHISERIHNEIIANYVGKAYSIVDVDDRFIWNICYVKGDVTKGEIESRINKLISFSNEHMFLNPVCLISNPFKFYQGSEVLTILYDKMRKIRFYSGKLFYQDDDVELVQDTSLKLDDSRIYWHIKKRDTVGYEEYIKSILDSSYSESDLVNVRNELVSIFMTNLNDNGLSSNLLFNNEKIKAKESATSKKDILALANLLIKEQINILQSMSEDDNIMEKAKKFIEENYRENITREDVALVAYVTPNYFSKLFWNHMGMNLREYINRLRIDEAKRLLLSTSMSVSEIASYVGYYNISYFSTVFRKLVGTSPVEWRESLAGER
ncbi:MAG: response regulator [Erysipelotrichaceae bacterium]|nr:response regulator [Erysipelotrichaceae bacterium]